MRIPWERYGGEDIEAIVAMLLKRNCPTTTRITPSAGEGGVDILDEGAAPDGGDVVYQVKRYTGPLTAKQRASVEDSLERLSMDERWKNLKVTQWCLVMPWDPTPEALAWLHGLGKKHGFEVNWQGLTFIDALAATYPRIIDAYVGSGHSVSVDADAVKALVDEIAQLSARGIRAILARLGDESAPTLEFPSPRTEAFLDRISAAQVSGSLLLDRLDGQLANVRRRAIGANIPGVMDASSEWAHLMDAFADFLTSAERPVGEVAAALAAVEERLGTALDRNLDISKAQGARAEAAAGTNSRFLERQRFEALIAYGKGLISLAKYIEVIRCEVDAAARRSVLVTGRWGTGKSYQLARYAQREIARGTPVLLLRARDFVDPAASIIGQRWWRSQLGCEGLSDEEFLESLDAIGMWAQVPLTIAIDGLNESSLRDASAALERLVALVERFPSIRLIVTDRQDEARSSAVDVPTFRHDAPARADMSHALETALGVPPGTPWHAALTNPLLASMAARIVDAQDTTDAALAASLSRVSLLNAWIDLLVREASAKLDLSHLTVRRLIASVVRLGGTCTVRQAAERSKLALETADRIIQSFVTEGLLEWHPEGDDSVRFRWQGAGDMLAARIALEHDRKRGAAELLQNADEASRLTILDTIAETLPILSPSSELPDLRIPNTTAEERDIAFALSLDGRNEAQVTVGTENHARRLLLRGDEPAKYIPWSVLAAPRRARLGAKWLNAQLSSIGLAERSVFWPHVLVELADGSPVDQDALRDLLTWYADILLDKFASDEEAADMIETLAWFGCASRYSRLPAFGVAYIGELVRLRPPILANAWEKVAYVDDDHPRDALLVAAAGVISRWPGTDAAAVAQSVCADALNTRTAKSFRSLASIHLTLANEQPLHEFLQKALDPLRGRHIGRVPVGIPSEDRAMFADGRSLHDAQQHEARVWASFEVPRRHARRVLIDPGALTILPEDTHGGALMRGRWLARQYAHHPTGARLWIGTHGHVKAGTALNPHVSYLTQANEAWDFWVDPTIPLELIIHTSDRTTEETWWAIDGSDLSVTVTDPEGVSWFVLQGGFRYLDPAPESDGKERGVNVGSRSWWSNNDDGSPRPGLLRHVYVAVSDALVATTEQPAVEPFEDGRLRFSELFHSDDHAPGGLVHSRHDDSRVPAPTSTLLGLLDAFWTGESIDCRDASGSLVVTDPARGTNRPSALLVRRDKLENALRRQNQVVTVEIHVSDMSASISTRSSLATMVQIG